jgi:uncharacterized hydrophobic protein (TIGR00271 family)
MNRLLIVRKILHHINLDAEVDNHDKIHEIIEKDVVFKGTNLWILIFAILVASVGLNMNSTAVIIGAMLISPLMGPINGVGYSIATYNFPLFYKAVKNYSFAVIASLITSTLYFAISPISNAHSELLARTSPTIYDVLIAFFGGLAGIVAISSKQKGNVIPGVAIATALMPPLCTAGFGIATGQLYFFFGAIYLFTINSVFIALASLLVSQLLKFPIRAMISDSQKNKINNIISVVGILIIIPSIYFGVQLVEKEKFLKNANLFVKSVSIYEGNFLLKYEIDPSKKIITLAYGGRTLNDLERKEIEDKREDFQLNKAKVIFRQGLTIDQLDEKQAEVESLKSELSRLNYLVELRNNELDSMKNRKFMGNQLLQEANALFPQIISLSYSDSYLFKTNKKETETIDVIVFGMEQSFATPEEKAKIERWLKSRLHSSKIRVYYEVNSIAVQ